MKNIETKTEKFYEEVLKHVPGMVGVYSLKTGEYLYVNEAVRKLLGYKPDDFIKKGVTYVTSLVHPDDLERITNQNAEVMKKANSPKFAKQADQLIAEFEYRMKHKNGKWIWLHTDGSVFKRDSRGRVSEVLNVSIDITQRKQTEEQLEHKVKEEAEKRKSEFQSIAENSPDIISRRDLNLKFLYINPAVEKATGVKPDKFIGKAEQEMNLPRSHIKEFNNKLKEVIKTGKAAQVEYSYLFKGKVKHYFSKIVPEFDSQKKVSSVLVLTNDITERKQNEEIIKENEERLRIALSAGKIGVWDWDIINSKVSWTSRVYEIHGLKHGEFDGSIESFSKLIHEADREKVIGSIRNSVEEKIPYLMEFRIVRPNGEIRWISTGGRVVYNNGLPIRMLGATIDITERKNLERQKDEFIGIASHELKTPVTSIKAFAQVLQLRFKKQGDTESTALLSKMDAQLNKLTALISDLLDSTKIETGKLIFHLEKFDLNELAEEIIDEMQLTTNHKIIEHLSKTPLMVNGDRDRMRQVFINLISNAIKYSPRADKIVVRTFKKGTRTGASIQDFGIGIIKKDQSKIFERFYRGSGDTRDTYGGMGLGLYISSEIVKRHNGEIWVESKKGKGSKFQFWLKSLNK